ncbi:uncharacterized protein CLUP02_16102 [Colletotrichum lupini]|uniref:Uncharacterized protein n=1 Tax=Colletotrichum lupini TaxID=145971 RepID=A0A9Q8T9A5_9PEZI|nr:uncharacterized protein CLUP02_16102 [Colletotrichum lupini]UQC90572.1 hypothetical protein CLUP02_16102 [Colletotrichum lupini]
MSDVGTTSFTTLGPGLISYKGVPDRSILWLTPVMQIAPK